VEGLFQYCCGVPSAIGRLPFLPSFPPSNLLTVMCVRKAGRNKKKTFAPALL
jgi:hypothetical protein